MFGRVIKQTVLLLLSLIYKIVPTYYCNLTVAITLNQFKLFFQHSKALFFTSRVTNIVLAQDLTSREYNNIPNNVTNSPSLNLLILTRKAHKLWD